MKVRRIGTSHEYELVHPPCALERAEDLEEVHQMIDAGEHDIAVDELRWLISGCPECLEAHQLLAELALADGDTRLARAHFGFAYDLGLGASPAPDWKGMLPFRLPSNRGFLTSAKGLALCLHDLGESLAAQDVVERLLAFDPSDPLRAAEWLTSQPRPDPAAGDSAAENSPCSGSADDEEDPPTE